MGLETNALRSAASFFCLFFTWRRWILSSIAKLQVWKEDVSLFLLLNVMVCLCLPVFPWARWVTQSTACVAVGFGNVDLAVLKWCLCQSHFSGKIHVKLKNRPSATHSPKASVYYHLFSTVRLVSCVHGVVFRSAVLVEGASVSGRAVWFKHCVFCSPERLGECGCRWGPFCSRRSVGPCSAERACGPWWRKHKLRALGWTWAVVSGTPSTAPLWASAAFLFAGQFQANDV